MQTGLFGGDWWKENIHLSHSTFNINCNELRPYIQTSLRFLISVEERVVEAINKHLIQNTVKLFEMGGQLYMI